MLSAHAWWWWRLYLLLCDAALPFEVGGAVGGLATRKPTRNCCSSLHDRVCETKQRPFRLVSFMARPYDPFGGRRCVGRVVNTLSCRKCQTTVTLWSSKPCIGVKFSREAFPRAGARQQSRWATPGSAPTSRPSSLPYKIADEGAGDLLFVCVGGDLAGCALRGVPASSRGFRCVCLPTKTPVRSSSLPPKAG